MASHERRERERDREMKREGEEKEGGCVSASNEAM